MISKIIFSFLIILTIAIVATTITMIMTIVTIATVITELGLQLSGLCRDPTDPGCHLRRHSKP